MTICAFCGRSPQSVDACTFFASLFMADVLICSSCIGLAYDELRPKAHAAPAVGSADWASLERAKLTPSLRYAVLKRDGFRCKACGLTPEAGAHLHIDHIRPVSRGGETRFDNLQALCATCNIGKGASLPGTA